MNDRTQIAAMALQGLLASAAAFCETPEDLPNDELVPLAVALADELLAALERIPPPARIETAGETKGAADSHAARSAAVDPGEAVHGPGGDAATPTASNLASPVNVWDCEARFDNDPACPGPAEFDPATKGRFCGFHLAQVPEGHRREMHRLHGHRNRPTEPIAKVA